MGAHINTYVRDCDSEKEREREAERERKGKKREEISLLDKSEKISPMNDLIEKYTNEWVLSFPSDQRAHKYIL